MRWNWRIVWRLEDLSIARGLRTIAAKSSSRLRREGEKVLAELALHHHDELRSAGPELVTALRRIMREGSDASPQHSAPPLDRGKNSKHP